MLLFLLYVHWSMWFILFIIIYMQDVADRLPQFGKRELLFLLSFSCNYVGFYLFLLVLGIGCVILLWLSMDLPYHHGNISVQN